MRTKLIFERSDTLAENRGLPAVSREVVVEGTDGWIQLTYEFLRTSPDGEFVAGYNEGCWWFDNQPWSDVVVVIEEEFDASD